MVRPLGTEKQWEGNEVHIGMQDVTVGTKSGLDKLCMIERKYRTDTQDARCRWPREDRQEKGIILKIRMETTPIGNV